MTGHRLLYVAARACLRRCEVPTLELVPELAQGLAEPEPAPALLEGSRVLPGGCAVVHAEGAVE